MSLKFWRISFWSAAIFCGALLAAEEPIAVYLTFSDDPQKTMAVQWITSQREKNDTLQYRCLEEKEWTAAKGVHLMMPQKRKERVHLVELKGLEPGQSYTFQLPGSSVEYKFRTISADREKPVRFVVGGDIFHHGIEAVLATNRQAARQNPDFALLGGDIAYASSTSILKPQNGDRWIRWLQAWHHTMVTEEGYLIPMVPVVGNHDVTGHFGQTKSKAPFYFTLFATPGREGYFVLDFHENLSIWGLDSGHAHPVSGAQAEWLAQSLLERRDRLHKFAFYHVPAYPSYRSYQDKYIQAVRKNWSPIFDQYGLTAAFEHHDHTYKRTHRIYGEAIDPERGVLYLGDGAWGANPRTAKNPENAWYLAKTASSRHFILVEVDATRRVYRAIDSDGNLIDELIEAGQVKN